MKKGQATPFIIVGIIVVILVVVIIYVSKPVALGGRLSVSQVQPIKNYIEEDCIKSRLKDILSDIREHSGYLLLGKNINFDTEDYLPIGGGHYTRYVCCGPDYQPRRNNEKIEEDISKNIKEYLINECKLDIFEDEFNIGIPKSDDVYVNTSLKEKSVLLNVKFPVVVRKGIRNIKLNDFSISVNDDIAKVNEIVGKVVDRKNNGEVISVIVFAVNSEAIMGTCNDLPPPIGAIGCILYKKGEYYHIWTRYNIDNNVEQFKFAMK